MAIQVNHLNDAKGIEFILSGIVHGKEIIEVHKKMHTPEVIATLKYKIVDKSKVTENYISAEEAKTIACLDKQVARINPNIITALVTPNELLDTIGSLWEAFINGEYKHLKRFRCREEADNWIAQLLNPT